MILSALAFALLALPVGASAAAPSNDDFVNRQVLPEILPISTNGSNLEATKESEEPAPGNLGFSNTGHTVWYEWKATSSGFVTVDTCGSTFRTVLGVYSGSAVDSLTEVAGDFASEGPDCPKFDGSAITFKATSGVTYEIVVDGQARFFGEENPGQGSFALAIDHTPIPANDDFADAQVLSGGMEGRIYSAGASGFTWNATKEAGEPAHVGNPGGASVWYAWTPPFSGTFLLIACGRFEKTLLAVYTGSSVDSLTPVASDDHSCSLLQFAATTGTTYRIAVDGKLDSETGLPLMGAISVNLTWSPPEAVREEETKESLPIFKAARPNTIIDRKTLRPEQHSATFAFRSTQAGSKFRCSLDGRAPARCSSPKTYRHLSPGRHVFKVVAVGPAETADLSPGISRFKLTEPHADRHS